jgi:hypothetical protein
MRETALAPLARLGRIGSTTLGPSAGYNGPPPCEAIGHDSIVIDLIGAARTTRGHAFRTPSGSPSYAQPLWRCAATFK